MIHSPGFKPKWFHEAASSHGEGWRLDFKYEIYSFDGEEDQFTFVRHLIALSNVARRVGKPSWMMFGVKDDDRSLRSVRTQSASKKIPGWWNDPKVSDHKRQKDGVEEVYRKVADNWIAPTVPEFHLEYGVVDGVCVSYLQIEPTLTSRPFCLKRTLSKNNEYGVGTVFVRMNSSSVPLVPGEVQNLLPISEAEYLDRPSWGQIILKHSVGDFEEADTLTLQFPLRARGQATTAVGAVMQALDDGERVIMLLGNAGEGKTVLLHKLAYDLAQRHNPELVTRRRQFGLDEEFEADEGRTVLSVSDELEVVPTSPVPVYFPLRIAFDTQDELRSQLITRIRDLTGRPDLQHVDRLFKISGSRWVILLDGVDEIPNRKEAAPKLRSWVAALPTNVQVVIASRPYAAPVLSGQAVTLSELSSAEALEVVKTKMRRADPEYGVEQASRVEHWLSQHVEVLPMMTRHRAIDGLIAIVSQNNPLVTEIDRAEVLVIDRMLVTPTEGGKADIPVIPNDPFLGDELIESADVVNDESPMEDSALELPQVGLVMRSIVEHMRQEEVKRQQDWGDDRLRALDEATEDLGRTAWHTDWEEIGFSAQFCVRMGWLHPDALLWNEDIGFLVRDNPGLVRFMCWILRCYLAAEYGTQLDPSRVKLEVISRGTEKSQLIFNLLNDLLEANGRAPLRISTSDRILFPIRRLLWLLSPSRVS